MKARILIIDDEESIRFTFEKILVFAGYEVGSAGNCSEAMERLYHSDFDLVITDIILPDGTGIDLFKAIRMRTPACPVILMTAYPSEESSRDSLQMGAYAYLPKPLRQSAVLEIVSSALAFKTGISGMTDRRPPRIVSELDSNLRRNEGCMIR